MGRAGSEWWHLHHGRWQHELWNIDFGNIFLIYVWEDQEVVLDETLQRNNLKCFTGWELHSGFFSTIYLFLFFFFFFSFKFLFSPTGYDTCILFPLLEQKCFWNYDFKPLIFRNTKNDEKNSNYEWIDSGARMYVCISKRGA